MQLDPHQIAMMRVKKELLVPQENLASRVSELRATVLKEKNATEEQLNTLTQSQVLQARKAMATLATSMHNIETLQGSFGTVMENIVASQQAIEEYATLRQVYTTLCNIREARRWIDRFFNLESETEDLYEQIKCGEVLEAYKTIADLNAFKQAATTTLLKDGKYRDGSNPFRPYFNDITAVTNSLVDRVQDIFGNVLIYFDVEGAPEQEAVFAAIQVVMEEAEHPVLLTGEKAGQSRLSQEVVMDCLAQAVDSKWDSLLGGAQGAMQKLEGMSEFVETLSIWEYDLLPAFPSEYQLKPWFVRMYHTRLVAYLQDNISGTKAILKLSSEEHMAASQWIEKYVKALATLEVDVESGLITAMDMAELQDIAALFQRDAIDKMKDWILKYSTTLTRDLLQYPVEVDPDDDSLFSMGPIEYFKFLQSQLKTMGAVSPPAVVLDVASCCIAGICKYQENLISLMQISQWKKPKEEPKKEKGKSKDKEKEKEREEDPEPGGPDWRELRLKYLCAFINDTKRMDENAEQLLEAFQRRLSEEWHSKLSFEDMMCGFHDNADALLRLLSKHLVKDVLEEAWVDLFGRPRTADSEFLEGEIICTLQDYLQDVDVWLDKFLLMRLHRSMVVDMVATYLHIFLTMKKEYGSEWGTFLIKDAQVMKQFWEEYVGQDVDQPLDSIHSVGKLIQATELGALTNAVEYILRNYDDCSRHLLGAIIAFRSDLDTKTLKKEVVSVIVDRYEKHKASRGTGRPAVPSVFATLQDLDGEFEEIVIKRIYKGKDIKDKDRDKDKDKDKDKDHKDKDKDKDKEKEKKEKKEKKDKKGKEEDGFPGRALSGEVREEDGVEIHSLATLGITM